MALIYLLLALSVMALTCVLVTYTLCVWDDRHTAPQTLTEARWQATRDRLSWLVSADVWLGLSLATRPTESQGSRLPRETDSKTPPRQSAESVRQSTAPPSSPRR
jgi:hypothetical protein